MGRSSLPPIGGTPAVPTSQRSAIILMVDDEQAILLLLCDLLEDEGYTVLIAHDGVVALSLAQDTKPDIVLTDLMMPAMDGGALGRRLRADPGTARIPLIAMTVAYGSYDAALFAHVIAKPFEIEPLLATIAALLPAAA